MVYDWWTNTDTRSSIPPIIAFIVISVAMKANTRLMSYRAWKREWDAMNGEEPRRAAFQFSQNNISLILSVIICGGLGYSIYTDQAWLSAEGRQSAVVLFALFLIILSLRSLKWVWKTIRGTSMPRHREFVVAQCLPTANETVKPQKVLAQLPDYCRQVMRP